MVSELRRAFEIGFLIVLPFLVIDMIVATMIMSMGMMMMPPTVDLAAVQDPVLHPDRRLEPAGRRSGAVLFLIAKRLPKRYTHSSFQSFIVLRIFRGLLFIAHQVILLDTV